MLLGLHGNRCEKGHERSRYSVAPAPFPGAATGTIHRGMTLADLRALLADVPQVELEHDAAVRFGIDAEVAFLQSKEALDGIGLDVYWPKWNGPWWIMLLLYELGEVERIPSIVISAMTDALAALPLHVFPLRPEEWPDNADRKRDALCHCAVGCMDQVLAARDVDVDRALPWVLPWYARYQMADGGYNCDDSAYLAQGECPSSMVGTVAPFEAMIRRGPSELCDRAAALLIERELVRGSATRHNAEEQVAARSWQELCFPRFYFYDVLRGASALVRWATEHGRPLPLRAIAPVAEGLARRFPDGVVRVGRAPIDGKTTLAFDGERWENSPANVGSLLALISRPGTASPALTRRWNATRSALLGLIDAGQISP
jgi:hypothetical protein